ncbi:MAG: sugar phosphate nucleotidyltransferase [Candidatus Liptonbacteria bacterium]
MAKKIEKIVLPVAGIGKRLQPLTLTTPKNLIPLAGKPILEYALDEARAAGLNEVILIISPQHVAQYEEYLKAARAKYPELNFRSRVQQEPLGHGHAILQAADLIRGEPFLMRFCDDIILGGEPTLAKLMDLYYKTGRAAVLLARGPKEEIMRYGVVVGEPVPGQKGVHRITNVVEKPPADKVPSELYVVGGYALGPEILENLIGASQKMEQKADALPVYAGIDVEFNKGLPIYGWEFTGDRLDCGTLEGLDKAEQYMKNRPLKTND